MHLLKENEKSNHEIIYTEPFMSDIDLYSDILMFHTDHTISFYESKEKKVIAEVTVKIRDN